MQPEKKTDVLVKNDKLFHLFLIAAVAVFALLAVYFYATRPENPRAAAEGFFLSNLDKLKQEEKLQEAKEVVPPGAIRVPIIIYHSIKPHRPREPALVKYYDVAPPSFEEQMKYLKDANYTVISLDYLADALNQTITLPPKSAVITFDDGWENQYVYAFPILRKYSYTATFFVFTDAIDKKNFLSWQEIKEMDSAGMTIGDHTRSHPYLLEIKDKKRLEDEIVGAKKILEDNLGHAVALFAYPFGHYNEEIIRILKESGFAAARSSFKGIYHARSELYKLKGVEATDDFDRFVKNLNK